MTRKNRQQLDLMLILARLVDITFNGVSFYGLTLLALTIYIWFEFNKEVL